MDKKNWALLLGGFLFGSVGLKALASDTAKKVYVKAVAGGMRAKASYEDIVEQAKAEVADIVAAAKFVNTAEE